MTVVANTMFVVGLDFTVFPLRQLLDNLLFHLLDLLTKLSYVYPTKFHFTCKVVKYINLDFCKEVLFGVGLLKLEAV